MSVFPGASRRVLEGACWGADVRKDNNKLWDLEKTRYKGWPGLAEAQTGGALLILKNISLNNLPRLTAREWLMASSASLSLRLPLALLYSGSCLSALWPLFISHISVAVLSLPYSLEVLVGLICWAICCSAPTESLLISVLSPCLSFLSAGQRFPYISRGSSCVLLSAFISFSFPCAPFKCWPAFAVTYSPKQLLSSASNLNPGTPAALALLWDPCQWTVLQWTSRCTAKA